MKRTDLKDKKFHKLIVLEIDCSKKNKWLCKCECGNIKSIRSSDIIEENIKSCGCLIKSGGFSIKPGDKFNRLTAISYQGNSNWLFKCDCGNEKISKTGRVRRGGCKSCGCLKTELLKKPEKLRKFTLSNLQYSPHIGSARRRWKSYCYVDKHCNITFEEFYKLSQMPCYYCGIDPFLTFNAFNKKLNASDEAKNNGDFIYNGLDRIDSSKYHTIENCVPCCFPCNFAKSNRDVNEFKLYLKRLFINNEKPIIKKMEMPEGFKLVSVKSAYRYYIKNYGSMEIDIETFYNYSQCACHYCGVEGSNYINVYLKDKKASQKAKDAAGFNYNGIDRVDSLKDHNIDNIVPCCKYCNMAKSNRTLEEFHIWIKRIKQFNG